MLAILALPGRKPDCKGKTYLKSTFPREWKLALDELEETYPILWLCANQWKADACLGYILTKLSKVDDNDDDDEVTTPKRKRAETLSTTAPNHRPKRIRKSLANPEPAPNSDFETRNNDNPTWQGGLFGSRSIVLGGDIVNTRCVCYNIIWLNYTNSTA